ncbi:LPD23 domain-containing protein, partial [Helicobacter bilis]
HKESGAKGEYKGQVAGAFHRKELGDIDLVWGEVKGKGKEAKGYGLAKIIEKHGDEFKDIAKEIDKIIQNGKVITQNGVSTIWYKKDENIYKLGISKGFHKKGDNNWIITSYKAEREKDKTFGDALFTDKHPLPNSSDIIPQQTLESTMQKFNYDYKKAKDLLEWHKDSSPLTKDENGLPKVFYHGTTLSNMKRLHNKELKKPFEVFNTKDNSVSNFSIGNWFSNDKNLAKNYADDDEGNFIYEVFLNIKKPFIMEKELTQEKIKEIDKIFKFTKKDKERGLKAVENLKQAKAELKESGFEFLQYDRESVKIRHIESGKEFSTPLYNLKKEDLHESIRAYEADLKHNPNLDESLQELKELDSLLKKDSPTLYEADFEKEFFKNETELYILAAARENKKLQEIVGGHYGVYGGYGRMYQTARIYPLQQFYKKAGYDGILFDDREIVAFDSNQIKHIDNKGSYTDTKGNITKTKPKNKESTHKYFNENSPNIMYANPSHLGAGVLSGTAAGIETDENGNIIGFNPAKFAAGFLGGVAGSKAVAKGLEWRANKVAKNYPNIAKDNPALMSEIAKKDLQTYAVTNTHNALTRFLNNNKALDVNPQLFAGEKALVNESYAPHKARLERAKELESSGADEIEIWEKTGWYKDKDKKWKFEISQSDGEFDFVKLYKSSNNDYYPKLKEVLQDKQLFQAYPELQDLEIIAGNIGSKNWGEYYQEDKLIALNTLFVNTKEKAKSTLYHEIQHAIQDIEG